MVDFSPSFDYTISRAVNASVAQSVEQGTENPRVGGSIPPGGTILLSVITDGPDKIHVRCRSRKAALKNNPVDCFNRRGFAAAKRFRPEAPNICGCSSSGRAPPCQGGGSEFEPRQPLQKENACPFGQAFCFPLSSPLAHANSL